MNCCVVDLETSSLEGVGAGFILCAVVKPLGKKPVILRYDELKCRPAHEKRLIELLIKELDKYELWIGHNIGSYDFNFIKSRASILGVPFTSQPFLYDTMLAFRRSGFLTSRHPVTGRPKAGLDHVVDFFGIPQKKTKVGYPRQHWRIVWEEGDDRARAMDNLVEHCRFDVELTEAVYWKLIGTDKVWGIRRSK